MLSATSTPQIDNPHTTSLLRPPPQQPLLNALNQQQQQQDTIMLQQEEEACSMPHGLQIVDFSKLNLSNMSADELEQLYIQTHCNNHIVTCPHTLQVTVKQISLARMPSAPTLLKLRFRNEKATTKPTQTLLHHHDRTFQFKVSYHALLFDTLKLDIFEYRPLLSPARIGRVRVRLNSLSIQGPLLEGTFNIEPKHSHLDSLPTILGKIRLKLHFLGAEFAQVEHHSQQETIGSIPPRNLPTPISIPCSTIDSKFDSNSFSMKSPSTSSMASSSLSSIPTPSSSPPVPSGLTATAKTNASSSPSTPSVELPPLPPPTSSSESILQDEAELQAFIKVFENELNQGRGVATSGYDSPSESSSPSSPSSPSSLKAGSINKLQRHLSQKQATTASSTANGNNTTNTSSSPAHSMQKVHAFTIASSSPASSNFLGGGICVSGPLSPQLTRPGRSLSSSSNFSNFSTSSFTAASSSPSNDATGINSGSALKRSLKRGALISERTRLGIKEFSELAAAFANFNWKISKVELAKSLIFLQKYFNQFHPNQRTYNIVTDASVLRVSVYWLGFSMATYGSLVMNYFGHGKGYLRDFLRVNSDVKTAISHLELKKEDMLVWEYGTGLEVFKPKFYICRDRRTDSLVVCFRGTFDVHDALTDLNAEYVPFLNGYVHRGFLRSAKWVEEHYLEKIKGYLSRYECSSLYVVGHSLGGAIATIFTMLLRGHLPDLKACTPRFKNLYCYTHASPPSASANLAEEFKQYVDTYVNENDVVPRLSYGSVLDFRELIIAASGALKMKASLEDKMRTIDMRHRQLKECEEHSKVYIVGNIYYIYKTSRIYGSKGTPPPWGDLHSPTLAKSPGEFSSCSSQNSSNSSSSCTVASFSPDTPSTIVSATQMDYFSYQPSKTEINFTSSTTSSVSSNTASQHPFIDFAEKHYVVERSDKDHFASVHVKTNMLYHHFPNKYDNGLRKAHEWIVKKNGNNTK